MIVISAGMQKSGSAYLYNIINDLLVAAGQADARHVKEKHKLDDVLQWHNNNVGDLENGLLYRLMRLSRKEKSFVVKTHSGPTGLLKLFLRLKLAKVIYVYRDPRDVLLSVFDHGNKIVAEGKDHTFAKMLDVNVALHNIRKWIVIWQQYSDMNNVLSLRYERLLAEPAACANEICTYLGISVSQDVIAGILHKYDRNNENANMKGLHFNKAKAGRFTEDMKPEDLKKVNSELGSSIIKMGYQL